MFLAVGCPVARRDWVIDRWFDHLDSACARADIEPIYVFVGDAERDPTFDHIRDRAPAAVVVPAPLGIKDGQRDWGLPHRYKQMVELRNRLLETVRIVEPDLFLSIDSDILAHPNLVERLLAGVDDGYGAVGGKCYMTPAGTMAPSWANLTGGGGIYRSDSLGRFPVDAIMAIKMMTPRAYRVDYRHHGQGEDIGWSLACREHGVLLAWDGSVASKHVMERVMLDRVDPRVGF
jgi:hypothetical protein